MADKGNGEVECPVCGKFWDAKTINTHVNKCLNAQVDSSTTIDDETERPEECHEDEQPKKRARMEACEPVPAQSSSARPVISVADNSNSKPSSSVGNVKSPQLSSKTSGGKSSAWGILMQNKSKSPKSPLQSKSSENILSSSAHAAGSSLGTPKHSADAGLGKSFFTSKSVSQKQNPITVGQEKEVSSSVPVFSNRTVSQQKEHNNIRLKPSMKGKVDPKDSFKPLAERMRPKSLKEYVGQENVVGRNKLLRLLVESHQIPSIILWGPPGCGKTTLARIIAEKCKETHDTRFVQISATTSGVADVKEVVKVAKNERKMFKRKTVLFIDEVHRFNKLQQDSFLPHIEDGTLILIGATTENPSFQINNALLSRCRVMVLEKLSAEHVEDILCRALETLGVNVVHNNNEEQKQCESNGISIDADALTVLSQLCDGDARSALNGLQHAVESKTTVTADARLGGTSTVITIDDIKEVLQRSHVQYDRAGEEHYNCASAFQKSIRGSSDNGAIYWLARMIEGGEDPLFIARRLVVCASEDIGLADPHALPLAMATFQACQVIGMPECSLNLAHCTTYLARAPKSNEAYAGLKAARMSIQNYQGPLPGVPLHLRNAPTKLLKDIGCGVGYKYNHAYKGPVQQEYLPESLRGTNFFQGRNG